MPVNDGRAVMVPVTPFGKTRTPEATLFVNLMMFLLMGPEVWVRMMRGGAGTIKPVAVPVKFVNLGFIPFLKVAAAIRVALADAFALGP
jgi:hypothetical protein